MPEKLSGLYVTAPYKSAGRYTHENARRTHSCAGRRVRTGVKEAVAGPGRDKMPAGFARSGSDGRRAEKRQHPALCGDTQPGQGTFRNKIQEGERKAVLTKTPGR